MSSISIGLSVCAPGVVGETAPAITGTAPTLDPITEGQTLNDVVTAGSANPPAGETFTGASPINEQNIDGGGWVAYVSSTAPTADQTVQVRQRWETVEGSSRTFTSVERTVAYAAPTITASDALAGRTLTITRDSLTGTGATVALTTLTLDGVDVSGDATETIAGQEWTYAVPSSASSQTVAWEITATLPDSQTATASGSEVVTADLSAPAITGVPTISGTEQVGETLTASAASVTGNPTPTRTWQWVNSASGDISGATSSTYVLQASDEDDTITVRQTETNGIGSDSATSAATGAIAAAVTAPDFSAFVVGAQVAETIDIDITSIGAGTRYASIVFVPAGDPAPNADQIEAGTDSSDVAAPGWIDHYAFTGDVVDASVPFDRVPSSGVYDAYAVITDAVSGGAQSEMRSDPDISISGAIGVSEVFDDTPSATGTHEAFNDTPSATGTHETMNLAA